MRILTHWQHLGLPDPRRVAVIGETPASWAMFFIQTYYSRDVAGQHDDIADPQATHHYFYAIFGRFEQPSLQQAINDTSLIDYITQTYLRFEACFIGWLPPRWRLRDHSPHVEAQDLHTGDLLIQLTY